MTKLRCGWGLLSMLTMLAVACGDDAGDDGSGEGGMPAEPSTSDAATGSVAVPPGTSGASCDSDGDCNDGLGCETPGSATRAYCTEACEMPGSRCEGYEGPGQAICNSERLCVIQCEDFGVMSDDPAVSIIPPCPDCDGTCPEGLTCTGSLRVCPPTGCIAIGHTCSGPDDPGNDGPLPPGLFPDASVPVDGSAPPDLLPDGGPLPDGGATCTPPTLTMWLAVDASASLAMPCGGDNCWSALKAQLMDFMGSPWGGDDAPNALRVVGNVFPISGAQCDGTGYTSEVALGELPGPTGAAWETYLDGVTPAGVAPTEGALRGLMADTAAHASANPNDVTIAVLLTDGGGTACDTSEAALAKILSDGQAVSGTQTYVVGLAPAAVTFYDALAAGGGTSASLDGDLASSGSLAAEGLRTIVANAAVGCD